MLLKHLPHSILKVHSYNPNKKREIPPVPGSWDSKITKVRGIFIQTKLRWISHISKSCLWDEYRPKSMELPNFPLLTRSINPVFYAFPLLVLPSFSSWYGVVGNRQDARDESTASDASRRWRKRSNPPIPTTKKSEAQLPTCKRLCRKSLVGIVFYCHVHISGQWDKRWSRH